MELIEGSETSANYNRTPGKYSKEYIQDSKHGESLKSRIHGRFTTLFVRRNIQARSVYRLLARQLTRDVPTDAVFVFAEAAMLGDAIKGTVCTDRRESIIIVAVYVRYR